MTVNAAAGGLAPLVSVIIPTLNETGEIEATLEAVRAAQARAPIGIEVIVADGGSDDGTFEWLKGQEGLTLVASEAGRARQMNAGAARARGRWLFFLHADTHVAPDHFVRMAEIAREERDRAFAFELAFRSEEEAYRRMERGVAWRCRTFALPYGDQGFCLPRAWFDALGGFRTIGWSEDLDLVLRLYSAGKRFEIFGPAVRTSTRQWQRQGIVPGIAYNLVRLFSALCLYFVGGEHFRLRREAEARGISEKAV